eukprot:6208873-Pleurochrysis_carterae.AAC.8
MSAGNAGSRQHGSSSPPRGGHDVTITHGHATTRSRRLSAATCIKVDGRLASEENALGVLLLAWAQQREQLVDARLEQLAVGRGAHVPGNAAQRAFNLTADPFSAQTFSV